MYQNAHAVLINRGDQPQAAAARSGGSQVAPRLNLAVESPLDPQFASNLSAISDNDTDPLANEFAALDAMEWTGNWDQSLLNLGFTDRDNMNQDFYTFCQEPDPLHPNTVFQQLVANSNAEVTDFFDGSGLGLGASVGAFGMGLIDEHEGIEASQILQSLSAAEDERAGRVLN
ncbi:hypothetical protein M7I_2685 [Glarea lozoyensis 74030]|nr:hypothetical protein M7I_2685 [Glarea lozoyensis 74030]